MPEIVGWISLGFAVVSIAFNLWQYHRHSRTTHALRGSLSAWWHWAKSMKDSVDMYWDAAAKEIASERLLGVAKGTIDGLAKSSGRLSEDVAKTTVYLGFSHPSSKPWQQQDKKKGSNAE